MMESASASDQHIDAGGAVPLPKRAVRSSWSSPHSTKRDRPVSTVLIDRSALFRAGLAHILAGSRFRVKTTCSSLSDLSGSAFSDKRCVALISLDGTAAAPLLQVLDLKARYKHLHIITLTNRFHEQEFLDVINAGAAGYLIKSEISPDFLVKSLELTLIGGVITLQRFTKYPTRIKLDTASVPQFPETASNGGQPQPATDAAQTDPNVAWQLSNKEELVLKKLTHGDSNKLIARDLNIAEATVKVHVKSLLRKIRVTNRTQAALWAMNRTNGLGHTANEDTSTSCGPAK